jgi:hypothetical protein
MGLNERNWIYLGKTQGRGRMDRAHQADGRCGNRLYPHIAGRKTHPRYLRQPDCWKYSVELRGMSLNEIGKR